MSLTVSSALSGQEHFVIDATVENVVTSLPTIIFKGINDDELAKVIIDPNNGALLLSSPMNVSEITLLFLYRSMIPTDFY